MNTTKKKLMAILLTELLDSSSDSDSESSSSDDDDVLQLLDLYGENEQHFLGHTVPEFVNNYTEDEFRQNFRVSRKTASKIIDMFRNSVHHRVRIGSGGRKGINAEIQCYAFLWFAGNKEPFSEISNRFNMSMASFHNHLMNFLEFLFDISREYIKFPSTPAEKNEISNEFAQIAEIEDVLGCIDGCYIYIQNPVKKVRAAYTNPQGLVSMTLQGICDANKKFLDVFIGLPSKIHDSRIYDLSFISKDIPEICGQQYHLLGDAAYPLREYLLTPYEDVGHLTVQQKKFNEKHAQTRVKIEDCFSLLKQRFRQLTRLSFFTIERICKFVLACCVLHNLCISEGDLWEEGELLDENIATGEKTDDEEVVQEESLSEVVLQHLGQLKRDNIADRL